jgi:hypothetical protein
MSSTGIARFPPRRAAVIWIVNSLDGWLVLAPSGHGWLHQDIRSTRAEAEWLAANFNIPIRRAA